MLRKGLLILGGALALLSVVGLAANHSATLLWFVVMAAMLSIGLAFVIEDEHALGMSRGAAPAMIGIGLIAVFVVGLASHQPAWAVWLTFVLGAAALGLSMAVVADRHFDLHVPRHG
jgi:FtsH-binding integral membrane protein